MDRIDTRVDRTHDATLICNKCGALFSTKNINCIGARSIKPLFTGIMGYAMAVHNTTLCDALGHKQSDLRLINDNEFHVLCEMTSFPVTRLTSLNIAMQETSDFSKYTNQYFALFNDPDVIMDKLDELEELVYNNIKFKEGL